MFRIQGFQEKIEIEEISNQLSSTAKDILFDIINNAEVLPDLLRKRSLTNSYKVLIKAHYRRIEKKRKYKINRAFNELDNFFNKIWEWEAENNLCKLQGSLHYDKFHVEKNLPSVIYKRTQSILKENEKNFNIEF